jgi:hypothetical protein
VILPIMPMLRNDCVMRCMELSPYDPEESILQRLALRLDRD